MSSTIKAVPLGAGQDVGRSCVLVTLGRKNIMFDCGMHMGYNDDRRFPDFYFISKRGEFTKKIDCVIISHFHLDHCGGLPYFSEVLGYDGPIYMTYPTKAIAPILLEDFRKITVERKGESNFFTSQDIKNCMKKVVALNLHQTVRLEDELEIKPFYAGHVLGAAMFYVRDLESGKSVVYTGDYNMTPDRHLGAAQIERLRPDLLITETTYATTIRDAKSSRERDFLKEVHQAVERGGKVLIPVFALGRVQELCILLETFWERMNLNVPIYFSAGLVEKANYYYQLFINWTNQKIKKTFVKRNMFEFNHIQSFNRSMIDNPGPMVLFSTPGMLHAGMSLEVFKRWAGDEKNLVIIPGYCVEGTVGNRVLKAKELGQTLVELDKKAKTYIDVKCQIKYISFSAHADAKGILQLIRQLQPKNIMLVHGEKEKMNFFKNKVEKDFKIPCYDPPNGCTITIESPPSINVNISINLLRQTLSDPAIIDNPQKLKRTKIEGILVMKTNDQMPCLLEPSEAASALGLRQHKLKFSNVRDIPVTVPQNAIISQMSEPLVKSFPSEFLKIESNSIQVKSVLLQEIADHKLVVSWSLEDDNLGEKVLAVVDEYLNMVILNSSSMKATTVK